MATETGTNHCNMGFKIVATTLSPFVQLDVDNVLMPNGEPLRQGPSSIRMLGLTIGRYLLVDQGGFATCFCLVSWSAGSKESEEPENNSVGVTNRP